MICFQPTPQNANKHRDPFPLHDPRYRQSQNNAERDVKQAHTRATPSLVRPRPIRLLLVEQIRPRRAEIYNLRTPVPVLLQPGALEAVEGVGDALAAAHDALVLVVAEAALVADAHEGGRADVGVADGTLAVALVAEAADGYAGLFAAHY